MGCLIKFTKKIDKQIYLLLLSNVFNQIAKQNVLFLERTSHLSNFLTIYCFANKLISWLYGPNKLHLN